MEEQQVNLYRFYKVIVIVIVSPKQIICQLSTDTYRLRVFAVLFATTGPHSLGHARHCGHQRSERSGSSVELCQR